MRNGGLWAGGPVCALLAVCVPAAGRVAYDGLTGDVRLHGAGRGPAPYPDFSYTVTWWPVALAVAAALAARLCVAFGGARVPDWLASVAAPAVTAAAGAGLVAVAVRVPYAYGARCPAGDCVPPESAGPVSLGAPFLVLGTMLALAGFALRAVRGGARPARARGVLVAAGLCGVFGLLLHVGSAAIVEGSNTSGVYVSGPAVPVGVAGAGILCAALPRRRRTA